jgi:hypothetical protein
VVGCSAESAVVGGIESDVGGAGGI